MPEWTTPFAVAKVLDRLSDRLPFAWAIRETQCTPLLASAGM